MSLDELCARADYLSLHMPSTPHTQHIFNAERLARCKKGLRIVNTARGDLIDEAALVGRDRAGHVGGAALDVFESEPTKDHALQKLPQVVASRTSRRPRAKARNWWAWKPPPRCATS